MHSRQADAYHCLRTENASDAEDDDSEPEPVRRMARAAAPAPQRARCESGARPRMSELPSGEDVGSSSEDASDADSDVADPLPRKARAGVPALQCALRERGARPSMAELPSDKDADSGSADASGQHGNSNAGRCGPRALMRESSANARAGLKKGS